MSYMKQLNHSLTKKIERNAEKDAWFGHNEYAIRPSGSISSRMMVDHRTLETRPIFKLKPTLVCNLFDPLLLSGDIETNPGPKPTMRDTCLGYFYFSDDIPDFTEIVLNFRNWDFHRGIDYDFAPLIVNPTDQKLYAFLAKVFWDEISPDAMFHLPYRFHTMFNNVDVTNEGALIKHLLLLAGDVEMNPGPTFSRPVQYRNNDPRYAQLTRALDRRDQKVKTLLRELRRQIKSNKIYAQGSFFGVKDGVAAANDLNVNLNRVCNFLENNLPVIQSAVQNTVLAANSTFTEVKDDLIKIIIVCLLVRLLMSWKKYRTAVVVVLLFVMRFYGFDKSILDLVLELKAKVCAQSGFMEDLVYHPYFHTCGKIIFAVLSFICIKKIPGRNDWDNYISRLDRIPKALDGSKKIIDYCSEYFSAATDQVKMMVLGKTSEELKRACGVYEEVHEWAATVRKYLELEQRNKIDTDIDVANQVEALYYRGLKFQQDSLLTQDRDIARLIAVTILPARHLYEYVSCSPIKGGGPRMRPVCVWLIGESGIGKTEMVYPLCIDVLRKMGLMKKEDFHHQVYGRQVETEFWDGYKGQKIVIYDDAFQKKDDKTVPNPEVFEVIRSCNTFPQHLHMAALHDKNTFSAAELLLYTTNNSNVELQSLTHPEAFFNRMSENAYKVRPKREYSVITQVGSTGKERRVLDLSKINPDTPIDLDVYEFQKVIHDDSEETKWAEVGEPLDYVQFSTHICDTWKNKKTESLRKLKFLEQYAIRAQMGGSSIDDKFYDADENPFSEADYNFFLDDMKTKLAEGETLDEIEMEYQDDEVLWGKYLLFKQKQPHGKWQTFRLKIDNALVVVARKLKNWQTKIVEIVTAHPYLTALGFVSVALSMFAMYKWFEEMCGDNDENPFKKHDKLFFDTEVKRYFTKEEMDVYDDLVYSGKSLREIDEIMGDTVYFQWIRWKHGDEIAQRARGHIMRSEQGSSGDAKTVKVPLKRVEVATKDIEEQKTRLVEVKPSGDAVTTKNKVTRVEVGTSGDSKTAKQSVKRVEVLDVELAQQLAAQGCNDEAAHSLITDVLQTNTYRLSYMRGEKRVPFGNGTFIRGHVCMMPYHFFEAFYARQLPSNTIINFSQSGQSDIINVPLSAMFERKENGFELTSRCARLKYANGEYRDCVLVLLTEFCNLRRDIIQHFVRVEDQGRLTQGTFAGTYATFHENRDLLCRSYQWLAKIRALDKPILIHLGGEGFENENLSYEQRDCYEYNAPTQVGDCGSVVGLYNKRMERKLIGMHIAGDSENYGYACPLTQEVLLAGIAELTQKSLKNASAQMYFVPPKYVDVVAEVEMPEGLFVPVGKAQKQVGQAVRTSIVRSAIHGKLSKPITRPALLTRTMINGAIHDPLLKGLKKCGVTTAVFGDEEVESAVRDVAQVVLSQYDSTLDRKKYQRILSYEEAVSGTGDDDFMRAVNRTTSPGYPYCLDNKNKPGKTRWMGRGQEFDFTSVDALQLRADVERLVEDCKNGKISDVLFVDTLKDERRENAKVDVGKTRVFSAGPQHFVVAFRQHFLPFAAWLMHNRIDNEIAVGTNPYSVDWERITKKMKKKGNRVIAGDFGNFDGTLVAQVLWAIFWEIFVPWLEEFTDFSTQNGLDVLKTCMGLWTHLTNSVHIFRDNVYMWTHSQPSGNPFTVIINCLYNSSIMRLAWIRIMKTKAPHLCSMEKFRAHVSMISYGDDNILNISDDVLPLYNQETLSEVMLEMKHEYTDEGKSGVIIQSRTLEEVYFLKRGFVFNESLQRTVGPLKLEVIYEMLNWTRNTIDPNVILMSNIGTAFREIVFHGREEYDKLRRAIMRVAPDLPSFPQILTYEAYLHDIKYLAADLYAF